ncbi:oligosaccharide flippase family protein [Oxalobacteraceae bacterium A2-2]
MSAARALRLSLGYSFAEKYTGLVLNLAGAMLLSRMLTPDQIGVYSIAAVLAGMAQVLRDLGVGQYLVQARVLDRATLRAALGVSLAVAWLLAVLLAAAAPLLAACYHEPRLAPALQLLAANFLMIPFSAVTLACLRRALRFHAVYAVNTSYALAQLGCGVFLAWRGYGYLSLPCAALAATVASTLVCACLRPAELSWLPGWRGGRHILRFGGYAAAGALVDEAGVAAPDLIVGKLIGVAEAAMFGKAVGVLNMFNQLVTSAVAPVLLPLFALRARQGSGLSEAYLHTAACMTGVAWPFFAVVAVAAPELVRMLYGTQWDRAIPLIRIMCCSSALYSMFSMARYLLLAQGQVRAQARLDALAVLFRVAVLLLAAPWGLEWVAAAVVAGAVFRSALTLSCLRRLAQLRFGDLLGACVCSGVAGLACLAAALLAHTWRWPLAAMAAAAALAWLAALFASGHLLAGECRKAWTQRHG